MTGTVPRVHHVVDRTGRIEMRAGSGARATLLAMGDLDFHKPIADRLRQIPAVDLFANVEKRLAGADLRLANLETVIVRNPQDLLQRRACLVAPLEALGALCAARLDIVTFANNHVLDMGSSGLLECLGHLEAANIAVAGAGPNIAAARRPAVLARNGIQFVVLAYSYGCGQIAGSAKPGCAEARLDWILEDLAREKSRSGLKIVCLHLDAEFQPTPAPDRVVMCRRIADAGADLVLCHHPHVIQGVEQWGTSLIAYSLGNYVTPVSAYMLERSTECHLSFHLEVECDAAGIVAAEVVPVTIDEAGRPGVAVGASRETLLTLIADRSSMLLDEPLLQERYRRMVAEWSIGTARLLYWSIGKRDWFTCRRVVEDLRQTPTKRRRLLDFAAQYLSSSLASWMVLASVAAVLCLTLYPWEFGSRRAWDWWLNFPVRSRHDAIDAALNTLLYVPFGASVYCWLRRTWTGVAAAVVAGAALSLTVEHMQFYLPGRVPNVRDIIANTCGSALGAATAHFARLSVLRVTFDALRLVLDPHPDTL